MPAARYLFTSESVTEGHPDKMADQISDGILDAMLSVDPLSRVAVETLVTTGLVIVAGEVTCEGYVEIPQVARSIIEGIGYTRAKYGFDFETAGVLTAIQEQSPDIAQGVKVGGAGDQGMMFGYACDETPELMPMPIVLAHKLARQLAAVRKNGEMPYLNPDGKSQVTVEYASERPVRVDKVIIAAHHRPDVDMATLSEDVKEKVIKPILPAEMWDKNTRIFINPTGKFERGGPQADTGLTGRKIIVDTYGGMARHGGGCFSGKDATKVDRSASYMMRYVAKNLVAAGLAKKAEVAIAYAIGEAHPLALSVDSFGTGAISDDDLTELVKRHFEFTPAGIIEHLDLRRPQYLPLAAYGHFGRTDLDVGWEKTDLADALREDAGV
ncbi:MAG: methionine adenosyltransferase [Armatimonadetes bacterium]|nr:methionine adenosyltransferase [Armatimonadota bacterium]NIM24466.1 methionine adenosyltransferase [Armatimonadota bacterium]NIM68337.1 methionine adenosyltransferase [Armatimonadota bacterium]NIM76741.1 methionine adenosyltransferase [Armatimonadota bacterium]NIN06540.1 methionine adenosyltransferase [Armatimonadota bacterium]